MKTKPNKNTITTTAIVLLLLLATATVFTLSRRDITIKEAQIRLFDGQKALKDVEYQVALGPRIPDSQAHTQTVTWIETELEQAGWQTEIQNTEEMGYPIRNIIGRWGEDNTEGPWIIIGAHYDSRLVANRDPNPEKRNQAVPGANDGASGVAVLLELARILPAHLQSQNVELANGKIWLVFFDAEDNGSTPGRDWILGSRAFVNLLTDTPDAVVIIDMIGDADLNIYMEKNSNPELSEEIWSQAAALGYSEQFIDQPKFRILDDHLPFIEAGIKAVDLIDFDYPYWHTTEDTADKVSAKSLSIVGDTLLAWLLTQFAR